MVMNANAEKAPEGHINIQDTTTHLLNQQPLDGANPVASLIIDMRPFNTVALDHRMGGCSWLIAFSPEIETIL
jgi:hypothetical protein